MIKKSEVRFDQLRSLLEGMGFAAQRDKLGWRFDHPASGARLLFRPYHSRDRVYAVDIFAVRSQLDWRGLMTPDAFDNSLAKTPA